MFKKATGIKNMFKIIKFGGSSLATPERIEAVANIVLAEVKNSTLVVVVSAFQSITNQLLECAQLAAEKNADYLTLYNNIANRHRDTLRALVPQKENDLVELLLKELESHLQGIHL